MKIFASAISVGVHFGKYRNRGGGIIEGGNLKDFLIKSTFNILLLHIITHTHFLHFYLPRHFIIFYSSIMRNY